MRVLSRPPYKGGDSARLPRGREIIPDKSSARRHSPAFPREKYIRRRSRAREKMKPAGRARGFAGEAAIGSWEILPRAEGKRSVHWLAEWLPRWLFSGGESEVVYLFFGRGVIGRLCSLGVLTGS